MRRRLTIAFVLAATVAIAGEFALSLMKAGMPSECADFAAKVSASEGNFGTTNQYGCLGAFQFCPGTFESYYKGSASSFLEDPSAQVAAWKQYQSNEWAKAQRNGLTNAVGKEVCYNGRCATVTEFAILMACQFGCGAKGKLANLVNNGMDCNARNVKDGNLVSVCEYLIRGSGFNVSCFTGSPADCETSAT